jgi:hypothetical protein
MDLGQIALREWSDLEPDELEQTGYNLPSLRLNLREDFEKWPCQRKNVIKTIG